MHRRTFRILIATSIAAFAVLANGAAANAMTLPKPPKPKLVKELAQLRAIQDRDGETYVWIVNGTAQGLPMK